MILGGSSDDSRTFSGRGYRERQADWQSQREFRRTRKCAFGRIRCMHVILLLGLIVLEDSGLGLVTRHPLQAVFPAGSRNQGQADSAQHSVKWARIVAKENITQPTAVDLLMVLVSWKVSNSKILQCPLLHTEVHSCTKVVCKNPLKYTVLLVTFIYWTYIGLIVFILVSQVKNGYRSWRISAGAWRPGGDLYSIFLRILNVWYMLASKVNTLSVRGTDKANSGAMGLNSVRTRFWREVLRRRQLSLRHGRIHAH